MERALLTDMGAIHDPHARRMLAPYMRPVYAVARRWPDRLPLFQVTRAGLAGRVLWHDEHVTKALDAGIQQVVIVGAGLDSRAWRLARPGVHFFEIDHPLTQRDKIRRAPGPGPTFVAADLATESAADALQQHGFLPMQPAIFVLEGFTMYLTEDALRELLRGLAEANASGTRLTADFSPPPDADSEVHKRQNRMQNRARAGSGETLRLLVDRDAAIRLVESCGWMVNEVRGAREIAQSLVPAETGLPVGAVNDRKTALLASLP